MAMERDTLFTSILQAVERIHPCTSILLAVERDIPFTSILLAVKTGVTLKVLRRLLMVLFLLYGVEKSLVNGGMPEKKSVQHRHSGIWFSPVPLVTDLVRH
jgi:hypothetical protein